MSDKANWILRFPDERDSRLDQNQECCLIEDRQTRETLKIRLHDYGEIYRRPGLYEHLFCDQLKYCSPEKVCCLLKDEIKKDTPGLEELCALDLGAGNGIAGEKLKQIGVDKIYGIDIEPEAEKAVNRDRPHVYEKFYTADLLKMSPELKTELEKKSFNCLVSVGSLGFDDIPPKVFATGFEMLAVNGWLAFNIKENFFSDDNDQSGFSSLIRKMENEGVITIRTVQRYCHRLSLCGEPLYYMVFVGKKNKSIPDEWLR